MAKSDYIFIDESGDIGSGEGDSSKYYATLAFHITDESVAPVIKHLSNWRYVRHFDREMKGLGSEIDIQQFFAPFLELKRRSQAFCSAVFLLKDEYIGPYLKPTSPRGQNPIHFRNFVTRRLLAHHFSLYPPITTNIELVFDRFEMSKEDLDNADQYLHRSYELPAFKHVTHADSIYSDFLQITSVFANCIKDVIRDPHSTEDVRCKLISILDITNVSK